MCDSTEKKLSEIEEEAPVQCSTENCSFWGRRSTNNLCSQCYKQSLELVTNSSQNKLPSTPSALETSSTSLDTKNASFVSSVHSSLSRSLSELVSSEKQTNTASASQSTQKATNASVVPSSTLLKPLKTVPSAIVSSEIPQKPVEASKEERKLDESETLAETVKVQKDKRRCLECNKFLGISGFSCRCKFVFCGEHRFPEKHNCSFDFEKFAKEKFLHNKSEAANFDKFKRDTEKL